MKEYKQGKTGLMARSVCDECKAQVTPWHKCGKPPRVVVCAEHICEKCGKPSGEYKAIY